MQIRKRAFFVALALLAIGQRAAGQWQSIGPSFGVFSLALASDGVLYAGSENGVYRRNPSTLVWEARNLGISGLAIGALVADSRAPGVLYAGSPGGMSGQAGGIFKTTDGGLTWTAASGGLINMVVQVLAIDPADSATLYAGTNRGGLHKSTDAGAHWTPANNGLASMMIISIAIDPRATSTVYVGADNGVYKSTDGGLSWRAINVGLRAELMPYTAAEFAIDPTNTSTVYLASFVPISFSIGGGVYKSTNGGDIWTPVNSGALVVQAMSAIVLDPNSPTTVYAAGERGAVVRTTAGADWQDVRAGLPSEVVAFAVDPTTAGTIYAATRYGVFILGAGTRTCTAGSEALCLNNSRFKVQVTWRVPSQGTSGTGQAVALTGDTGSFWFFSSNNIELVVKVLDGHAFNNKFWVFYGALSNVEYTITVTDTQTGTVKTYFNPQGALASVADTAAF